MSRSPRHRSAPPLALALALAVTVGFGAATALSTLPSCGPAFFVLAKVDDAVEDYKDRRPPPYICGNGLCDRERGETCRSCPKDCAPCDEQPPQLMTLSPESGKAYRWVTIFGTHLERIDRMWLAHDGKLTPIRHKRVGAQLMVFIPWGSPGGTLHVESQGQRRPTPLRYVVYPPPDISRKRPGTGTRP